LLNSPDGHDFTELKVGDLTRPFPLQLGSAATYELQGKSIDELRKWRYKKICQVKTYERQALSFGYFWTYKVRCTLNEEPEAFEEFYYSPTLRFNIIHVARSVINGKAVKTVTELLE